MFDFNYKTKPKFEEKPSNMSQQYLAEDEIDTDCEGSLHDLSDCSDTESESELENKILDIIMGYDGTEFPDVGDMYEMVRAIFLLYSY